MISKVVGRTSVAAWLTLCPSCRLPLRKATRRSTRFPRPLIGRWDVTVEGRGGKYPSWFEVRKSGHRTLVGSYVGQFESARPISQVEHDNGSIRFTVPPQWEDRKTDVVVEGRLEGEVFRGENHRRQRQSTPLGSPPCTVA